MARIGTFPLANDIRKIVRSEIWFLYRSAGDPERVTAANRAVSAHRDVVRNEYWQLMRRTPPK